MFGFGKGVGQITETEAEKLERLERERLHAEKEEQLRLKTLAEKEEQDRIDLFTAQKQEQLRRKALEEVRESYAFPKEVPEVGQKVNVILYSPLSVDDEIVCFEGTVRCRRNFKEEGFISISVDHIFDQYEVAYVTATGTWWDYSRRHGQGVRKEAIVTVIG